jgi:hypothetical protein
MLGQQAGNLVRGALAPASAGSLRRDDSWAARRAFGRLGRGLICGLVYAGARGSIGDHWLPLTTQNDDRGRTETAISAPEKRKVGSSILPLTTTLTCADVSFNDRQGADYDACSLISRPSTASGRSHFRA